MKKVTSSFWLLMALSCGICAMIFWDVLIAPGSYLFGTSVDPIKSYFNFSYFLRYDSGFFHNGINYPYGDHLQYINSHPLLAWTLTAFRDVLGIEFHGVAIMNLLMVGLFWAQFPLLFWIMRHYSVPGFLAVIGALLIGFMSPQLERIGGHFEMVYAVFIPLYWYLLIRYLSSNKRLLWSIILVTAAVIGGLTSAYFVAFYSIFLLSVILVDSLRASGLLSWRQRGFLLLTAILPLILVKGLVSMTDLVSDRPDNPWGFFVFHSDLAGIFSAKNSPWSAAIQADYSWEGKAYLGIVAAIVSLAFILLEGRKVLKKTHKEEKTTNAQTRELTLVFWSGALVLLFAMCIPFRWGILTFLLDWVPQIKQFRALGRFSWIFYYAATVMSWVLVVRLFRHFMKEWTPVGANVCFFLLISLWTGDAVYHVRNSTKNIFNQNNRLPVEDKNLLSKLTESGFEQQDYQAIFCLPFASTCGDKLLYERGHDALAEGMRWSYQTGIPLIQSFSPRLSFSQALSSAQLLSGQEIYPSRIDDMTEEDILLISKKGTLDERERALASKAARVMSYDEYEIWRLPIHAFDEEHHNWSTQLNADLSGYYAKENYLASDSTGKIVLYENFDDLEAEHAFSGSGAYFTRKGEYVSEEVRFKRDNPHEWSAWLYVDHRVDNMPSIRVIEKDRTGNVVKEHRLENRQLHDIHNGWARVSLEMTPDPNNSYTFVAKHRFLSIDDLLVRPIDSNFYIPKTNGGLWNNFWFNIAK